MRTGRKVRERAAPAARSLVFAVLLLAPAWGLLPWAGAEDRTTASGEGTWAGGLLPGGGEGLCSGASPATLLAFQQRVTVAEALLGDPQLSTFATLVEEAGLLERLRQPGHVTVFAPTEEAFGPYRDGRLEELRSQPRQLERFVRYHFIEDDIIVASGGSRLGNGSLNPIGEPLFWPETSGE